MRRLHENDSIGEMLLAEKLFGTIMAQMLYSGHGKKRLLGNTGEVTHRQIHSLSYNRKVRRAQQALCQ